jgi:hypothetical protein
LSLGTEATSAAAAVSSTSQAGYEVEGIFAIQVKAVETLLQEKAKRSVLARAAAFPISVSRAIWDSEGRKREVEIDARCQGRRLMEWRTSANAVSVEWWVKQDEERREKSRYRPGYMLLL